MGSDATVDLGGKRIGSSEAATCAIQWNGDTCAGFLKAGVDLPAITHATFQTVQSPLQFVNAFQMINQYRPEIQAAFTL